MKREGGSRSNGISRVAIIPCDAYEASKIDAAVNRAVELLGGWRRFGRSGQRFYVKPNLAGPFVPDRCVTTHPLVVRSVAEGLKREKCRITIGDSPAGIASRKYLSYTYRRTGMATVSEELDVPLDYETGAKEILLPDAGVMGRMSILASVTASDRIINLPKFKTHLFTRITGAVKNLYGTVHGVMKVAYHSRLKTPEAFSQMLLDLARWLDPQLTVVDAVVGMEGNGPTWGKARFAGFIIAGTNPLAVDHVIARMMGFSPAEIPLFNIVPPPEVEVLGVPIERAVLKGFIKPSRTDLRDGLENARFIPAKWRHWFAREMVPRPRPGKSRCTGCAHCAQSCPGNAIDLISGREAVVDYSRCIRCWCCHEVCPSGAIFLEQSLLGRLLAPLKG